MKISVKGASDWQWWWDNADIRTSCRNTDKPWFRIWQTGKQEFLTTITNRNNSSKLLTFDCCCWFRWTRTSDYSSATTIKSLRSMNKISLSWLPSQKVASVSAFLVVVVVVVVLVANNANYSSGQNKNAIRRILVLVSLDYLPVAFSGHGFEREMQPKLDKHK